MNTTPLKKTFVAEVAIVRILTIVFQLLFLKTYTYYTSIYELGIYIFLLTISTSLNAFLLVPLDFFQQSKLYMLREQGASLRSFFLINRWVLKFAFTLILFGNVICFFFKPNLCLTITLVVLLSLSTYFSTLLRNFVNNLEKRRHAIYPLLFETIFKTIFFLLFIQFYKSSGIAIISSILAATAASSAVLFILIRKLSEYKLSLIYHFDKKEIIKFAYPISFGAMINWIQLQSYSVILVPLGFVKEVGIFGTVSNVGSSGMNASTSIFTQLYIPNIYKTDGAYIKKYLRNALFLIAFVFIVSAFLSKIIVGLLTKKDLIDYSLIILYGVLNESGNFIIGGLSLYITIHNLTKQTLKVSIAGFFVFIISFVFLYLFKFINVYTLAIPMVLTQIVICLWLYIIVNNKLKNHV